MADARGLVQTTLTQLRASGISTSDEMNAALCAKLHAEIPHDSLKMLVSDVIDAEFGCHAEGVPMEEGVGEEALGEAAEEAAGKVEMVEIETSVAETVDVGLATEAVATEAVVEAAAESASDGVTDAGVATENVAGVETIETTEAADVATEAVTEVAAEAVATDTTTEAAMDVAAVDVAVGGAHEVMPTDLDLIHAKLDTLIDAHTTMQARMDELSFLVEHTAPKDKTDRATLARFTESFLFPEKRSNLEKHRAAINKPTSLRAAVNEFLIARHGASAVNTPSVGTDDITDTKE
jgi:hypothetical protein